MLCAKFGWNQPSVSSEDFKNFVKSFVIISPWKKAWPFIWTNLNSLYPRPRMLCAKFGCNLPSGSGEEFFFNFVNVFSLFLYYLRFEKGAVLHLNPLYQRMLSAKPSLVIPALSKKVLVYCCYPCPSEEFLVTWTSSTSHNNS